MEGDPVPAFMIESSHPRYGLEELAASTWYRIDKPVPGAAESALIDESTPVVPGRLSATPPASSLSVVLPASPRLPLTLAPPPGAPLPPPALGLPALTLPL